MLFFFLIATEKVMSKVEFFQGRRNIWNVSSDSTMTHRNKWRHNLAASSGGREGRFCMMNLVYCSAVIGLAGRELFFFFFCEKQNYSVWSIFDFSEKQQQMVNFKTLGGLNIDSWQVISWLLQQTLLNKGFNTQSKSFAGMAGLQLSQKEHSDRLTF